MVKTAPAKSSKKAGYIDLADIAQTTHVDETKIHNYISRFQNRIGKLPGAKDGKAKGSVFVRGLTRRC